MPARLLALGFAALALGGCGGDSGRTTTAPKQELVRIEVGEKGVAGGPVRATVDEGERVVLVVHSALADEVHLHGYDLSKDVEAGGTVRIAFEATIAGTFEVELESRKLQIAELRVEP